MGESLAVFSSSLPRLVRSERGVDLLVDGQPWLLIGGELRNSSASTLEFMGPIWPDLADLQLNTVLVPVSWRQLEPEEGRCDFALVDGLLAQARAHGLRLVLLWLATWKNGVSGYAPEWVLRRPGRFPCMNPRALSPFGAETCAADARAFAALLGHLREVDRPQHTVIMVQVENEVGLLGDSRDRSPAAEAAFAGPVPVALTAAVSRHEEELQPFVREAWRRSGRRIDGNWSEVFGAGAIADEIFMAWHLAAFLEQVAKGGKAVYPLPLFVNAWTVDPANPAPGVHPSGGPVARMLDVWMTAAPTIDVFAVDNYRAGYRVECAAYRHRGNPLFVSEACGWWGGDDPQSSPAKAFFTLGAGALGFAPFGIDNQLYRGHLLGHAYRKLSNLAPLLLAHRGTNRLHGFYREDANLAETLSADGYRITINYQVEQDGGAMFDTRVGAVEAFGSFGLIVQTGADEFVIAGRGFQANFSSTDPLRPEVLNLGVEDGEFRGGEWHATRVLNGDEVAEQGTGGVNLPPSSMPAIGEEPIAILRVRLARLGAG
jgi:hypothetical protein